MKEWESYVDEPVVMAEAEVDKVMARIRGVFSGLSTIEKRVMWGQVLLHFGGDGDDEVEEEVVAGWRETIWEPNAD